MTAFLYCSVEFDFEGGRRVAHLPSLVEKASNFTHVFVIVGDNDMKTSSVYYIYRHFVEFSNAVWPAQVRFSGRFKRRDLCPNKVEDYNIFLHEKLGRQYKSPRMIKWKDFDIDVEYHFDRYGQGYKHMSAFILSALEEFAMYW